MSNVYSIFISHFLNRGFKRIIVICVSCLFQQLPQTLYLL